VPEIRASNRQTRSLGERLAVNSVMQGTAADVIKRAMVAIRARLREEGRSARLVLQVHDELLLEAPEAEVSAAKELVREEMVGAWKRQGVGLGLDRVSLFTREPCPGVDPHRVLCPPPGSADLAFEEDRAWPHAGRPETLPLILAWNEKLPLCSVEQPVGIAAR